MQSAFRRFACAVAAFTTAGTLHSQTSTLPSAPLLFAASGVSTSEDPAFAPGKGAAADVFAQSSPTGEGNGTNGTGAGTGQALPTRAVERGHIGLAVHLGTSGVGVDLGIPVSRHFGVRVGGNLIRYTGTFQEDGATIDALLQFGYGRATLDWFPFHGRFHISPLLVAGNNTRIQANVSIDPSQQFDLNGEQFRGSATDPLHGVGRVELRHTAPGLAIGTGNLTRGNGHFVFPAELGFFYVAQPKLTVDFSGSVCDVSHPEAGCQRVQDNPDFQKDLNAFIARQNHNLTYAQFIPIVNVGIGYRF